MITQLSVFGRSISKPTTCKKAVRRLHTESVVEAKGEKVAAANVSAVPVLTKTFSELLEEQIDAYPHKDTYESQTEDLKMTTHQLNYQVYSITGSLHSYASNRKLAYTAQGSLRAEVLVGFLGAPKAGKLFASIPPFRYNEMISDLKKSSTQIFLFVPKVGKVAQVDQFYEVFPKSQFVDPSVLWPMSDPRVPTLNFVVQTAKRHLNGMVHHIDFQAQQYYEEQIRNSLTSEEVSTLVLDGDAFAAFSQSNFINTANALGAAIGLKDTTATLNLIAPSTTQGLAAGFMLPLVRRSKLVVASDDPVNAVARIHESIAQHGVSNVVGDAAVWQALLKDSQPAQTKAFTNAIKSGLIVGNHQPIDGELIKAIKTTLGVQVHTTHGTARTTGIALVNGQALPNTQVKLVDQHGKDTSSTGFLAIKGVNAFKRYYNDGALDTSSLKDGWVTTNIKAQQATANTFTVTE